jgi:hypothetical protein
MACVVVVELYDVVVVPRRGGEGGMVRGWRGGEEEGMEEE